jgi:YYY domain-containing protein
MLGQFLAWYLVVQLITLAALPLTLRLFAPLPDGGYAFARAFGILLVGVIFWLGYSYGLLRNDTGGVWLALLIVAAVSWRQGESLASAFRQGRWRYVLLSELLFLFVFAGWAIVRSYDPAVDHTEEPMDLMFMNSIWTSVRYPPQDAWLSGYAISYYYLGYWLVTTVGRLANQPPEIAYTLGQASWYGLLAGGCFGLGYNLLALRRQPGQVRADQLEKLALTPVVGGLLAAIAVAFTGNMQAILEWLYANGYNVTRLADWLAVRNFPQEAQMTNQWFISNGWWWWRTARVIADTDLLGGHREVIDETPIFSYILGDNHPHVLGLPFILVAIAFALALLLRALLPNNDQDAPAQPGRVWPRQPWRPLRLLDWFLLTLVTGAPIFLNTWDYPGYWLLAVCCWFGAVWLRNLTATADRRLSTSRIVQQSAFVAGGLLLGAIALYLPYLLTAQSQAGGIAPNLLNPTRFSQFLVMFLPHLLAMLALIVLLAGDLRPTLRTWAISAALVFIPILLYLLAFILLLGGRGPGDPPLNGQALPPGASSYLPFILERWRNEPWTLLATGGLLAGMTALLGQMLQTAQAARKPIMAAQLADLFVLLLAALGLALLLTPEVLYLRDNFGSRMNTVFKFYYQGWLLLGLSSVYAIVRSFAQTCFRWATLPLGGLSLILLLAALIMPAAGVYSRTNGFSNPNRTFDSTAYLANYSPAEMNAVLWVRANTAPDALVLEAAGDSYRSEQNRISMMTGRRTLLGWGGHQSQWRGRQYSEMTAGRPEALVQIYRTASAQDLPVILQSWKIDYIYIGPMERQRYQVDANAEARLAAALDLVFEDGDVRIYRRR